MLHQTNTMPHFWSFSHKRRRQDSCEVPVKLSTSEISDVLLRVDNNDLQEPRVRLTRKKSLLHTFIKDPSPIESCERIAETPSMSDVAVIGAGPAGLMLAYVFLRLQEGRLMRRQQYKPYTIRDKCQCHR
jgi:hypothetical protein